MSRARQVSKLIGTSNTATVANTGIVFSDTSVQTTAPSSFGFKNRVINGAFAIDQRNSGAAKTNQDNSTSPFIVDRFRFGGSGTTFKATIQQVVDAPPGFVNSGKVTITTSETLSAGKVNVLSHIIEGLNVVDFAWGTSSAAPATLSFWVKTSLTGTHAVAIRSDGGGTAYSYVASYTVSQANTWEYKTITVPGPTTGTWGGLTGSNLYGIRLDWNLGSYTDVQATANTWTSGGYFTVAGAVQLITNVGATFQITGVQLEKGSTATAFDYRPYGDEIRLCQRYFEIMPGVADVYTGVSASISQYQMFYMVEKRANATVQIYGVGGYPNSAGYYDKDGVGNTAANISSTSRFGFRVYNMSGSGQFAYTASAEL
jgi:hypothetical protein